MTIQELINRLSGYPKDMPVYNVRVDGKNIIVHENCNEYEYEEEVKKCRRGGSYAFR